MKLLTLPTNRCLKANYFFLKPFLAGSPLLTATLFYPGEHHDDQRPLERGVQPSRNPEVPRRQELPSSET